MGCMIGQLVSWSARMGNCAHIIDQHNEQYNTPGQVPVSYGSPCLDPIT